jgi:hypothetical protein
MRFDAGRWVLAVAVLLAVALSAIPVADDMGETHIDDAFKRALVGFALARALNGVISVAQGTEVAVQPAGIGVNFTPGQILDPVNDLVERFSWIMMLASSSLGVQKILLAMSAWNGLLVALVVCGGLLIGAAVFQNMGRFRNALQRLFLFFLILRFMMPAISIANDWVYRVFLEQDYIEASASLEQAQQAIGNINDEVLSQRQQEPSNLVERALSMYQNALEKIDIDRRLDQYRLAAESISENTIQLVVVFLMQTIVFPIIFLLVVLGVIRRLIRS